jgi:hypothetical protein
MLLITLSIKRLLRRQKGLDLRRQRRQRMHQNRPHLHKGLLPPRQRSIRTRTIRRGPLHNQTGPSNRTRQCPAAKTTTANQSQTIDCQTSRARKELLNSPLLNYNLTLFKSKPRHPKRSSRPPNPTISHHQRIPHSQSQHPHVAKIQKIQ